MEKIRAFLRAELHSGFRFFPPGNKIFRALQLVDYDDVKVVIIGQDPYHGYGQANGLAFAVESDIPMPPSLQNIVNEVNATFSQNAERQPNPTNFDRTLKHWAKQGVLLLNTVLTVRENAAFSHRNQGWEIFTDKVIENLLEKKSPLVFLCWGAAATKKVHCIYTDFVKLHTKNNKKNNILILRAPHPSPLSAHRGFFGCQHFKKANEFFKTHNISPIIWI